MRGCLLPALLAAASLPAGEPASITAARCKTTFKAGSSSQFVGSAAWQDQADRTLTGSTEDRTTGRLTLTCSVQLRPPSTRAVLDFGGARIAFSGSSTGGGLEIKAPGCRLSGLRVSGENWIELGPARYALNFTGSVHRVRLSFDLVDSSASGAIRADINPVTIRPLREGETTSPCPPALP